ncbi:unnamed protein product, partial [Rotaria magnacalcarata]
NLQRTIDDSDRTLKETRQSHNTVQSDYNRTQLHYEVSRLFLLVFILSSLLTVTIIVFTFTANGKSI